MTEQWAFPEVWERQPEEPVKAYAAFTSYRDMGIDRSYVKVARQFGRQVSQISNWAGRWQWVHRAQAWDAEQDRVKRNAMLKEIESAGRRQVLAGQLLMSRGIARIQKMSEEEIAELTIWEATRLLEVGSRMERAGHGEPPDPVAAPQVNVTVFGGVDAAASGDMTIGEYLQHNPSATSGVITGLITIREHAPDLNLIEGSFEEVVKDADDEIDRVDQELEPDEPEGDETNGAN